MSLPIHQVSGRINKTSFGLGQNILLLIGGVVIPILLALGIYDSRIALVTVASLAVIGILTLFYNVRSFIVWILPLAFFVVDNRFYAILLVIILVGFIAERLANENLTFTVPFPFLMVLMLLAGLNGMWRGQDAFTARFYFMYSLLFPVLLFLVIYNLKLNFEQIQKFLLILSVIIAFVGFISMMNYFMTGIGRRIYRWDSQNPAACIFSMIIPFSVMAILDSDSRLQKIWLGVVLIGVMAAIFVTQTRAVLVSGIVGIIYMALSDKRVLKVLLPGIILSAIAAPGLIIFRIAMLFGHGVTPDWSSVGRIQIWSNSLQLLPKYLFFGMGIESFRHVYPAVFPSSFIRAEHPHNIVLKWIFDYGIVGMVASIAIFILILTIGIRIAKQSDKPEETKWKRLLLGINAGVISALVANLFDSTLSNGFVANLFWIYLAILLTASNRLSSGNINHKSELDTTPRLAGQAT